MSETDNGATATIDDVAKSVSTLTASVTDMKAGLVDRETVERIAAEAVENSASLGRSGYQPDQVAVDAEGNPIDVERAILGASPAERVKNILEMPLRETASVLNKSVEVVEHFRESADQLVILSTILGMQGKCSDPRDLKFYGTNFAPAMNAAIDTQTATEGLEWVPREMSSSLIERVNLQLRVLALWPEITMPTNPYDIPALGLVRRRLGKGVENTADTGQSTVKKVTAATRKITLAAMKFWGEILVSKESEEDMIIPILALLQSELEDFLAADLEDTAINGDATGAHRDSDSDSSDDPRKNWDGLRQIASANSAERDHGAGDLTVASLRSNRKLMGKYGIDPTNLAHIIGMGPYIDLLSDTNVQTVDKYGANATLLTGELGRADNTPIVVSEFVRGDLTTAGVYDGVTKTRSVAITAHKAALLRGVKRSLTVEILREKYSEEDQDAIKISTRQALEERYPGEKTVVVAYNVDAT